MDHLIALIDAPSRARESGVEISYNTIQRALLDRTLKGQKLAGRWVLNKEDLDAYIEGKREKSAQIE